MNDQNRLAQLARRVAGKLPAPLHTGLQQLWRRATGSSQQSAPLLTVVVVATNAESYLSACLDSLRSQTLKRIEVLVVDNGSTDHTAAIAQEIADQDPRFEVVQRPALGLTASRNAGVRLARGRFLAFVDAADTVPRTAYANLINSLRQSGADFAAGSVRTVGRGRRRRPPWDSIVHGLDRPALTLADFPIAMLDASATNRVFRRDFWDLAVGGFPDSAAGESFAITSATLQARKFDLLQAVSYMRRTRLAPGKLLSDPLTVSELESRINWLWATWQLVKDARRFDDCRLLVGRPDRPGSRRPCCRCSPGRRRVPKQSATCRARVSCSR